MAKKKKIVKKISVKKKKNKNISYSFKDLKVVLILSLVLFLVASLLINVSKAKQEKVSPARNVVAITPSPTIMPTPTPTPLAQNYNGFCLKVPVLMYHHIQPESAAKELGQTSLTVDNGTFDQQMAYLAQNGYTTIWANELINALINHTALAPKSVVVTMDDGYADNDIYALPILRKYNVKANLMLATGLVGSNPDMLSWGQVNDMKGSGLYYFTNHTWSHFAINRGPQDKIETEIDTAQTQIQQYTGQTVNVFTYPYGAFSNNAINTLQKKGYLGAFTEIPGFYQCDSFIMTLHRTRVGNAPLSAYGI